MANLIQWNCKSILSKKHEISFLINKFSPAALALSETWMKPDSNWNGISGYACHRDDRADGYAGCAVFANNSIPFKLITLPPHSDEFNAVAMKIFEISIVSIYIPHPHCRLLPDLRTIFTSLSPPVIIMGDFNAHHVSWGSYYSDSFGTLLLNLMDELNFCILNTGSPTRRCYPSQNPASAVDLTFCSPGLAPSILWRVYDSTCGSDHFPIIISLPAQSSVIDRPPPLLKYKLSKADWSAFSSTSDNNTASLPNITLTNCLSSYGSFVDSLTSAADQHIPLKSKSRRKVSPPWWDSECTTMIRKRKAAEKTYSSCMSLENFLQFQKISAATRKLLSNKKRQGWSSFCENMSPGTSSSVVWRQIRRFRGSLARLNPSSNDPSSWIIPFADKLAPPFVPHISCLPLNSHSHMPHTCDLDRPFSLDELHKALGGLVDSSPGEDGIPYSFLSHSSDNTKHYYLNLINTFFDYGIIPNSWNSQIIIPLLKPGKDPSDSNSYRPIALSTVLLKIMEHMIKFRLEWFIERNNVLSKSQFGFRKGMSTMDSLSILTTDIHIAFKKKELLVGVFLDIASAYDNVLIPVLRQKLRQLSVSEKLVRFICNAISSRSIIIRSQNSILPPRTVWKGLPQGSVLSPLLYSIYTFDLDRVVNSFCQVLQYADDVALYVSSKSIDEACSRLNSALEYLGEWLSDHGLSISVPKCSTVTFTRKRIIPVAHISFKGEPIQASSKVKFLGVFLDRKLSGIPHFNHVIKKCEKGVNVLRSLSGVRWGAHPYSQKLLYNAIVRSHFDYGMFLLDPGDKLSLDKISKIQYKCLRIILGAMKSSPINALQVECVDPPLYLRRQFLSDRFFLKIIQYPSHPLVDKLKSLSIIIGPSYVPQKVPCLLHSYNKFSSIFSSIDSFPKNPLFLNSYDSLILNPNVILNFGICKNSPNAARLFYEKIAKNWQGWLTVFTDASKLTDEGFVGVAVWIPSYRIVLSFKLPPPSSVFTGESIAILEAINYADSHNIRNVLIVSDSRSCLQAISANPFRSKNKFPSILQIRESLLKCKIKGINIAFAWVPSHSGIPGNETADSCAKAAVSCGLSDYKKISFHDLSSLPYSHLIKSWNNDWQISKRNTGKHFANIQQHIPSKPWFFLQKKFSKRVTSCICRLRIGHACTPVHLAKIKVKDSSLCECGMDEGTAEHLVFNCPSVNVSLHDFLPSNFPRPCSLNTLLALAPSPSIGILANFLSIAKLKL